MGPLCSVETGVNDIFAIRKQYDESGQPVLIYILLCPFGQFTFTKNSECRFAFFHIDFFVSTQGSKEGFSPARFAYKSG